MGRDCPHWSVSEEHVRLWPAAMSSVCLLTHSSGHTCGHSDSWVGNCIPSYFSLFLFVVLHSFEAKESKQDLGPQNLGICRSWHLMAALPLVVASSYF